MYYGKMTDQLKKLYEKYEAIFGCTPDCYIELEYGQNDYSDYVRDIKKAIKKRKELPVTVGYSHDDWSW